jgi:hypothetical protein
MRRGIVGSEVGLGLDDAASGAALRRIRNENLAEQVASGELSLVKLRERIEGRPRRTPAPHLVDAAEAAAEVEDAPAKRTPRSDAALGDDALMIAKADLADALEQLARSRSAEVCLIGVTDRATWPIPDHLKLRPRTRSSSSAAGGAGH